MDNTSEVSEPNTTDSQPSHPKRHRGYLWIILLILTVSVSTGTAIYKVEHSKVSNLVHQNNTFTAEVGTLGKEIKQQNDVNNGNISPSAIYKDPVGGIGLVNGAITFTLPKGWVRVPQSNCTGGTIDTTAVCQDVASIAPTAQIGKVGTAQWSAEIGVYDYSSSDGSARSWYEKIYDGTPLADYGTPEATNISETPVNGYSALSFEFVSSEPAPAQSDYTNAYFTIVHGNYAIVVSAHVQAGGVYSTTPGSPNVFDYRLTYLDDLTKMVQTIKFQG